MTSSGPGVAIAGGATSMVHCVVADCAAGGILVAKNAMLETKKVHITRNEASGLEIREGASAVISETNIYSNGLSGAFLYCGGISLKMVDCKVHSHANESGLLVSGPKCNADLVGCHFYGNEKYALAVQQKGHLKLSGCEIYSNSYGILIQDTGNAIVEDCLVHHNAAHGIFVGFDHHGKAKIHNNYIHHNNGGLEIRSQTSKTDTDSNREHNNEIDNPLFLDRFTQKQKKEKEIRNIEPSKRDWARNVVKAQQRSTQPSTNYERRGTFGMCAQMIAQMMAEKVLRCAHCERSPYEGEKFRKCGQCQEVVYCNKTCQKKHWNSTHKSTWKPKTNAKFPVFRNPSHDVRNSKKSD